MAQGNDTKLKKKKLTYQLIMAVVLASVGLVLLILGMILPPTGEIHPSVLGAYGEISVFAGALFGVDYSYKIKILDHESEAETKKDKEP